MWVVAQRSLFTVTISKGSEGTVNQVDGVRPVLGQIYTISRTDGFSCSGYCQSIWTDYWEGGVELFLSFLRVSASNPTRCGAPGTRFR